MLLANTVSQLFAISTVFAVLFWFLAVIFAILAIALFVHAIKVLLMGYAIIPKRRKYCIA